MLLVNLFLSIISQYLIYVTVTFADETNISKFTTDKISEKEGLTILSENKLENNEVVLKKCPHVDPYSE